MANGDPRSGVPRLGVERPAAVIEVDQFLLQRLRAEARRRDMPTNALIRDVLDAVVAGGLIPAILDE
jgi:hypothetical protein